MQAENNTHTHQQHTILESLSQGATRTDAARAAGISRRTLYHWIEQDPTFKEAVADAEEETIDIARSLAFHCAMQAQDDPRYLRALFFYLKCKAGWSDRPQREATNSPDLVQEVAAEVIRSLQAIGVITSTPTHPESATHLETPEKHVQSVQQPTPSPASLPTPTPEQPTTDNEQPTKNVQSVQQPIDSPL